MKFLTKKQVRDLTVLSDTTRDRLIAAGSFPKGLKLPDATGRVHANSRRVWLEDDVLAWMRDLTSSQAAHESLS